MSGGDHVVKGRWSEDEDEKLSRYIRQYGHGHWEALAREAGLNRTGKSCRLRWLNYLRPGVRRGNISLQEQLIILQLHSQWGNRWAKIAECLPSRSDNEIKNYWRTRVQKQAKQLNCDVNSYRFRETVHHVWMPQLAERVGQTQFESATTMMTTEKLSNQSNSQSQSDATEPYIPSQLSHQSSNGCNNFNEHAIVSLNLDATFHGVAAIDDGSTYADLNCEKSIPCEECPWRKQGAEEVGKEEELATAAWFDYDIYSLENMWSDDEMGQTLIYDDDR